jgi:uncharacterized coiled-coil protein SlyX|tara:strand:- start:283 stop:483 length:201 start_codon:yes stop_codon:yes gene_type:complete
MSEQNKYEKLPENMLPQVKSQCEERIKALEKVVESQTAALAEALEGVNKQLEEAKSDLAFVESRMR